MHEDGARDGVGSLSRRRLIQGTTAFGLAAGFARRGLSPAQAATAFDPKKYAGTDLNILMTGDENDHRALGDLLPAPRGGDGNQARDYVPGARRR